MFHHYLFAASIGLNNAQAISGHAGIHVLKKHYTDARVLVQAETAKNFKVFGKKKEPPHAPENGMDIDR